MCRQWRGLEEKYDDGDWFAARGIAGILGDLGATPIWRQWVILLGSSSDRPTP